MKRTLSLLLTSIFVLAHAGTAGAVEYAVSANLPSSAAVSIVGNSITGTVWTGMTDTNMNFGDLVWTPGTTSAPVNLWLGSKYFAVDISNVNAGSPNVTISYVDKDKPSASNKYLGVKVVATVNKAVYNAATPSKPNETLIWSKPLAALTTSSNIPSATLAGGWCRVYLGVYTGSPAVTGAEGFTNADAPGTYTGTVTITALSS